MMDQLKVPEDFHITEAIHEDLIIALQEYLYEPMNSEQCKRVQAHIEEIIQVHVDNKKVEGCASYNYMTLYPDEYSMVIVTGFKLFESPMMCRLQVTMNISGIAIDMKNRFSADSRFE